MPNGYYDLHVVFSLEYSLNVGQFMTVLDLGLDI